MASFFACLNENCLDRDNRQGSLFGGMTFASHRVRTIIMMAAMAMVDGYNGGGDDRDGNDGLPY